MRNLHKIILISCIFASPLAADPVRGLFASLNVGGTFAFQNHDYTNPTGATAKEKKSNIAPTFGLSFGILNQIEKTKVVVGGEVSFSKNQARQKYDLSVSGGLPEGNLSITDPYTLGAYGIVGTMMTPKLMFFAKAGYAWMTTQLKYTNLNNNERPNHQTYKKTMSGLTGGGGLNVLVTNKLMIGGEYLFYSPTSLTLRKNDSPQGGVQRKFVYHPTVHTVSLKLSLLF